ncbi:RIP-like protein [Eupeodes corollae]|uniref:RIP-like protein n=1 Tax=Eupeodes corollae TaxID=290404 RepID=UPI0024938C10|nr:RIP-like protein [Eupeodes corollae]
MSYVQCPTSPIFNTSVEQKKHSRQAAKVRQFQFGSPQLRELLREKCRIRVREARKTKFDGSRCVGKPGENSFVSKILRQELADLETDFDLQELIYTELIDEMNMWFVQQMEDEEEYLINVGDNNDEIVFCPVCQKSEMKLHPDTKLVVCQCGVSFNFNGNLLLLGETLKKTFAQHELNCGQMLNFFVEQNSSNGSGAILNTMCESCDYFISVT